MPNTEASRRELEPEARAFYRQTLTLLENTHIPFLVGGAYALTDYTGIERHTKDIDIFVLPEDAQPTLQALAEQGYQTELTFPHWLGKARQGNYFVDIIFSSGNGIARVDELWFEHAIPGHVMGVSVRLCPVEEILWSKAFIMERERYDGADVAHLLHARADKLDWPRLLWRFGESWRVLLAHLILYGFIYPGERNKIPDWVLTDLRQRLETQAAQPALSERICRGTLLSREQYLPDIETWGYQDGRILSGNMTLQETESWTEAIDED